MSKELKINTEIIINATPEIIWETLTNFENYATWNPFVKSITGDVVVGQKIKVALMGMTFKPEVLVFDKNREFRWIGKVLFTGVFDGEHYFKIKDNGDGSCTFSHGEIFKGFLISLFSGKMHENTKSGFVSMNEKLKEESERKLAEIFC